MYIYLYYKSAYLLCLFIVTDLIQILWYNITNSSLRREYGVDQRNDS